VILVDAGPLVALLDADDQYHAACLEALKTIREPLATVWPAFTEAMNLLSDTPVAQEALWEMAAREVVQMLPLTKPDFARIRELMRKYADRPMDLADAALVHAAERENIRRIFTIDKKDFAVYRLYGRLRFTTLP
jgi:hypothetical protein